MHIPSTSGTAAWSKPFLKSRFSRGFGATIAITMLSIGTLALSLAALGAAIVYSDSINRREFRVQDGLNKKACEDSASLMRVKDVFVLGTVNLPEFDCVVTF